MNDLAWVRIHYESEQAELNRLVESLSAELGPFPHDEGVKFMAACERITEDINCVRHLDGAEESRKYRVEDHDFRVALWPFSSYAADSDDRNDAEEAEQDTVGDAQPCL